MVSNTGASSPGEPEVTFSTSDVAACRSNASERRPRASASSRVRASSCFFNPITELGSLLTRALAFVPVERSLRPRVGLFAPLRDKVTSSAQSLIAPSGRPSQRSGLPILTAPHDELAALYLLRSFDHLVGERDEHRWNFESEHLRGLEIDRQLEIDWRLHRQIGRVRALEDAIDIFGGARKRFSQLDAVGD